MMHIYMDMGIDYIDYAFKGLYTGACAFEKRTTIVSKILVPSNHSLKCVGSEHDETPFRQ